MFDRHPAILDEDIVLDELTTRSMEGPGGLSIFIEHAWPLIEPAVTYCPGWHIDAICEHLEAVTYGHIRDLIITVPPRHMKSIAVAVMWPCWEWGPANLPYTRWIFSAYAESLSLRDSSKRRKILNSRWYTERWSHVFAIGGSKYSPDGQVKYENDHTGYHLSTGVKGSNTGEGGDRIIVDDPHNVKEVESDTMRVAVHDWWDVVMSTRRNDPSKSARVLIMQRSHEDDLVGHILEKEGSSAVHLNLPSEYEGTPCTTIIGWRDPRTRPGELLFPSRFSRQSLDQAKVDLGEYGYAAQHQQRPAPAGGGMIKKQWWRFWAPKDRADLLGLFRLEPDLDPVPVVAMPWAFDHDLQSWDMAFKSHDDNSYVAGQYWGVLGAMAFLGDQVHDHLSFTETIKAFKDFSRRHPCATKLVEDKANGPAVIDYLRSSIPGIIGCDPEGSKEARVAAVSPYIEAGNVYLPHPAVCPWIRGFIHECSMFPAGKNDDQVDAMSQALRRAMGGQRFTEDRFASVDI